MRVLVKGPKTAAGSDGGEVRSMGEPDAVGVNVTVETHEVQEYCNGSMQCFRMPPQGICMLFKHP
jgi:hypothetical protein